MSLSRILHKYFNSCLTCFKVNNIDVDGLKKLPNLLTLDLSNNNIANVPPELGNVSSLRYGRLLKPLRGGGGGGKG